MLKNSFKISINTSKKNNIYKVFKIYVDINYSDGIFSLGQKLNSFFGQMGIFDGNEIIIKFLENFFILNSINYPYFINNSVNLSIKSNNEKDSFFFSLPIIIFYYFDDKKADFFTLFDVKKKLYSDRFLINCCINYLNYFEKNKVFFSKVSHVYKLKAYLNIFKNLKCFFKKNKDFFNLLNFTSLDFLINEDNFLEFYKEYLDYLKKRKKKTIFLKRLIKKKLKNIYILKNKFNYLSKKYVLNLIVLKCVFFNKKINILLFLNFFSTFISQISIMKNKLLRIFKKFRPIENIHKFKFKNFEGKVFFAKKKKYIKLKKKKKNKIYEKIKIF